MRYIDTSKIVVPANWFNTVEARSFNPLWSYFKKEFEDSFGKKCWYSESENIGAINPIDHFRPKANNVLKLTRKNADLEPEVWNTIDVEKRTGYSFLKLDFSNFRYTCTISNSLNRNDKGIAKGKSNFFPLKNGSPNATDHTNLSKEIICLLDPCTFGDPQMLFFSSTGFVEPHFSINNGSWEYCRVKVSIELYNLHYFRFLEKRIQLWNDCKERIEIADVLYLKKQKSSTDLKNIAYHIKSLTKKIDKTAQFSAVAVDCIKHFKSLGIFLWLDHHFPDRILQK